MRPPLSRQAKAGADEEACTFAPAINARSRKLLARSVELPHGFLERQQYLAAVTAEKKALYRSVVEAEQCSFAPAVHSASGSPLPSARSSRRGSALWARCGVGWQQACESERKAGAHRK